MSSDFTIENGVLKKYAGNDRDIVIPDNVTSIGECVFRNCSGLTSVTIGKSVTSIGDYAFYYCTSLTSVTIPDSVTRIGGHSFSHCSGLTSITIGNGVTSIGVGAFSDCTNLTSIKIPNSVESIEQSTFACCSNLTNITIPDSVTSIGKYAFEGCSDLTGITIPNSVTSIGDFAFNRCWGLTNVTISNSVTSIEDRTFYECCSLKNITIPDSVTSIGWYAFSGCSGLTSITISDSVTSIGSSAFSGCSGLTSITIPDSVTSIGDGAFAQCSALKEIKFGKNKKTVEADAFNGCTDLTLIFSDLDIAFEKFSPSNLPAIKTVIFPEGYYRKKDRICALFIPYMKCTDPVDYASLWIYQTGKGLTEWFLKQQFEAEKVLAEMVHLLTSSGDINAKQVKRVQEFISTFSSKLPSGFGEQEIEKLLFKDEKIRREVEEKQAAERLEIEKEKAAEQLKNSLPIEEYLQSHPEIQFSGELDAVKSGVRYKDYDCESSPEVVKLLLQEYLPIWEANKVEHCGEISKVYNLGTIRQLVKPELSEKIAAALDKESLSDCLKKLIGGTSYRYFCIPYARFATEESIAWCMREIAAKKKGRARERYWAENLENALYYSDTKDAADYLEKHGDFEQYVRLRGMTVQEYRDSYALPDFGFDADGIKKYTVGGKELEIRITKQFDLSITEKESGKILKSIPKTGTDGKKIAEEFADLKKEIKEFYKKRIEYAKKIYITCEGIAPKIWNETYLANPLFRPIVEALIWQDESKNLFEVSGGKCRDINGAEFTPSGNVSVAHVLDMTQPQINAWQKHLIASQKTLLVEQVWEPVVEIRSFTDLMKRYDGIEITRQERNELKARLKAKAISVKSEEQIPEYNYQTGAYEFDSNGTMLIGHALRLDYEATASGGDAKLGRLYSNDRVGLIKRELNTVIFELDRVTVKPLISGDNSNALRDEILSRFTAAQICELIDYAAKCKSTACTARLLEFKNKNFGETSAFDAFVLD